GSQASWRRRRSRLPSDVAVTARRVLLALIPPSETFRGRASPGGVQADAFASRAPSAAASCCAVGLLAGFTLGGWSRPVGLHDGSMPGTLMHAWTSSVQTPSTLPSRSQALPSAQERVFDVMPLKAIRQAVAFDPSPAKQAGPGQAAKATTRNTPR